MISIHAPAKGATRPVIFLPVIKLHFNPRSREGSDRTYPPRSPAVAGFQSTLPRRERPHPTHTSRNPLHFNPRSREGSDGKAVQPDSKFSISIHAPAKGATPVRRGRLFRPTISIHAPAKGATSLFPGDQPQPPGFQSTLPRRERRHKDIPA